MLEFRTLGAIELRDSGGRRVDSVLQHPKLVSLLAYLCASYPPRMHRRDTLVALLWPELDEAHARGALRQELYQLRRALGRSAVRGERADTIGVSADEVWSDAQEFEAAIDEGRLPDALALLRGEFLPGLHLDGGEFERWLDEVRDRLTRRAVEAAKRLAADAELAGETAAGISWLRRLTELAPYDETARQQLMRLLDRQGDRAGALKAYDELAARLRNDLQVEPSPETQALMERIRDRDEAFAAAPGLLESGGRSARLGAAGRALIGLQPVENQTGDATLDVLARRVTDRLAQVLAGAMFVEVAPAASERGVSAVVSVTLYRRGEQVEAVPRLAQPGEGGRLLDMPRTVLLSPAAADDALDTLAAHVLASVAAHYDPRFDAAATPERALPIPTPLWQAYLEYIQGAELYGQFQYMEGYRHLLRAWELDPDFVKAGVFAGIALATAGDPAGAEALTTRAMRPGRPLYDYERLLGGWLLAAVRGRHAEAYRMALEGIAVSGHPISVAMAGREAAYLNRPRETLRRLEAVDMRQGWWRNQTQVAEFTGGAHHILGNHRAELASALDARSRFPASLDVLRTEVRARAALGQAERVLTLAHEALTLPAGLASPVQVVWVAAQELDAHGHADAAAAVRRIALGWVLARRELTLAERQLHVHLLLELGDAAAAANALAALAPEQDLDSLALAGLVPAHAGNREAARQVCGQLEALQNPYLGGRHLLLAAGIQAVLDPPEQAIATLRRAFADGLSFGVELHALPTLRPLAACAEFRALLAPRD